MGRKKYHMGSTAVGSLCYKFIMHYNSLGLGNGNEKYNFYVIN